MKKAILFISPVLILLGSCQALHRDIPKSKNHYQRRELVSREKESPVTAVVADREPKADVVPVLPEELVIVEQQEAVLRPEVVAEAAELPVYEAVSQQIIVSVPQGDTLVEDEEEIDEAVVDEALESERIARQAYQFSFVPIFTLLFFPLLFVGLIGTLSKLARFKRYEYVTEKGLEYERRAKRTLIASIVVPLLLFVFFILLIIAFL